MEPMKQEILDAFNYVFAGSIDDPAVDVKSKEDILLFFNAKGEEIGKCNKTDFF